MDIGYRPPVSGRQFAWRALRRIGWQIVFEFQRAGPEAVTGPHEAVLLEFCCFRR